MNAHSEPPRPRPEPLPRPKRKMTSDDIDYLVSELRRVAKHLRPNDTTWRIGVEVNNIELLADLLDNAADTIDDLIDLATLKG